MRALVGAVAAGLALAAAPVAMAHVSVLPATAVQGQSTEFTVRVPAEEGRTTTGVRVLFPRQVTVYAIADAPGWTSNILKRRDGTMRGVEWTGGSITPGHYADFTMLGTPFDLGQTVWPAWQDTNAGVKRWTGPPEAAGATSSETGVNAPGPASAIDVVASADEAAPAGDSGSGTSVWLGVIAIAVSLAALASVGLVWASRPRELPPDGPEDR